MASKASIGGHPVHPMLIPFPIACFVLTLVSDLAFWRTANEFWANASLWLLGVGLIMAQFIPEVLLVVLALLAILTTITVLQRVVHVARASRYNQPHTTP